VELEISSIELQISTIILEISVIQLKISANIADIFNSGLNVKTACHTHGRDYLYRRPACATD